METPEGHLDARSSATYRGRLASWLWVQPQCHTMPAGTPRTGARAIMPKELCVPWHLPRDADAGRHPGGRQRRGADQVPVGAPGRGGAAPTPPSTPTTCSRSSRACTWRAATRTVALARLAPSKSQQNESGNASWPRTPPLLMMSGQPVLACGGSAALSAHTNQCALQAERECHHGGMAVLGCMQP